MQQIVLYLLYIYHIIYNSTADKAVISTNLICLNPLFGIFLN